MTRIPLLQSEKNVYGYIYYYSCVTRCRRFGKSMAAKMLCAYYDKSCDSRELFAGLEVEKDESFEEYRPGRIATSLGFTHQEVEMLCQEHGMDIREMERWYDGYRIGGESHIFNPYSVMRAIDEYSYQSYWSTTGAYDSVKTYIQMNFDGLKDDVIRMLAGERVYVNTSKFQNDMRIVRSRNDVLTVLIHLGYLAYDQAVEHGIDQAHDEHTSILELRQGDKATYLQN